MKIQALDFVPPPGFRNPWLQSVLGQVWFGKVDLDQGEAWEVDLGKGASLVCTHNAPARGNGNAVVIVHGLGGFQDLFHILRMAEQLLARGYDVVRMNMRGCGPSKKGASNALLGGHSDDLALVLEELTRRLKPDRVELLGYSFGGNMVLRYAGLVGERYTSPIAGCIAVSAPVDLVADIRKLKRVCPAWIQRRVARGLVGMVQKAHAQRGETLGSFPQDLDFEAFEAQYIAPVLGDNSSDSFYRSMSAAPHLSKIAVPTHVIWSQDDPAVDVEAYALHRWSDAVRGYRSRYGGHVGFCRPFSRPPKRWWLDGVVLKIFDDARNARAR